MYACVVVCTCTSGCVYPCVVVCMHMWFYMYACVHACTCACMHVWLHVYVYSCMCKSGLWHSRQEQNEWKKWCLVFYTSCNFFYWWRMLSPRNRTVAHLVKSYQTQLYKQGSRQVHCATRKLKSFKRKKNPEPTLLQDSTVQNLRWQRCSDSVLSKVGPTSAGS